MDTPILLRPCQQSQQHREIRLNALLKVCSNLLTDRARLLPLTTLVHADPEHNQMAKHQHTQHTQDVALDHDTSLLPKNLKLTLLISTGVVSVRLATKMLS